MSDKSLDPTKGPSTKEELLSPLLSVGSDWLNEFRPTTVPRQYEPVDEGCGLASAASAAREEGGLDTLDSEILSGNVWSQSYDEDYPARLNKIQSSAFQPSAGVVSGSLASGFLPSLLSSRRSTKWLCEDGVRRSGNIWTAVGHIVTAVIGSGVLGLPYAMAGMGWILGAICFIIFAWITLFTAQLLADLYIIDGKRMRTFTQMVQYTMGKPGMIVLGILQQSNLVLTALAYTITAGTAMKGIATMAAGDNTDAWYTKSWVMGVIFGGVQIFLSQCPDLESFWWASAFGAVMSFGYSTIALGLGIAYHGTQGGIQPMEFSTTAQTVWNVLNSIGTVLFAYSFAMILLEIQDTLADSKGKKGDRACTGPISNMKWAVNISVGVMTGYYCAISWSVFASLGYDQKGYVLDDYKGVAPDWVIYMAEGMVIAHLVPAYQVWSQPHFALTENWLNRDIFEGKIHPLIIRLTYRTLYVVLVTFLGVLLPFFQSILGFVGAIGFWPMTVYFPIHCWIKVFKPTGPFKVFLYVIDVFCLVVTLAVLVASVESMIEAAKTTKLWS
jgi:amino acid permease